MLLLMLPPTASYFGASVSNFRQVLLAAIHRHVNPSHYFSLLLYRYYTCMCTIRTATAVSHAEPWVCPPAMFLDRPSLVVQGLSSEG